MIYISLTTVPKRLNNWHIAKKNLESLLQQNAVNFRVILSIPVVYKRTGEEYLLPKDLIQLANENGRLIINREDEDCGPILKVIGGLRYAINPDDYIIACDDDHVYHQDMINYYMHYGGTRRDTTMCHEAVLCYRGDMPIERRQWEEGGKTKYMLKPTHLYFPVMQERQLLIPGHWHSVCYKRSFFEDDFYDIINKGDNDDILVGYYMKKKGIDVKCIPYYQEKDGRPVNDNGRSCFSFPIVENLPTEDSGFNEFRKAAGDGYGRTDADILNYIHNNDIIFEK